MKRYFLLLLTLLPLLAKSQNVKGPYLGVTSQLHSSWIINDEQYDDVNYKQRFATKWAPIGFVAGYKFNENHNLQAEAYRSHQGASFDLLDQEGNKAGEKDIELVYWNFPLLFKYTTPGKVRFNFQVGPQLGVLQSGREENRFSRTASYQIKDRTFTVPQGTYLPASTQESDRASDARVGEFNRYDLGVLLGTGVEVGIGANLVLTANLRFNYNFVNIRKEEHIEDLSRDSDYYVLRQNMVGGVHLGLQYLFNTGDGTSNARHQ